MTIDFLTLFPEMFDGILSSSILGRAEQEGLVEFKVANIRDYTLNKHQKCDDYPYGGGAGMIMTAQPIVDAIESLDPHHEAKRIYLSPKGKVLTTQLAKELSIEKRLLFLCGRYEGVDQRAIDICIDEEISIGDFILTGGELASMVVADSVLRFVDGVLGNAVSSEDESFANGRLEYPQYTRPAEFRGLTVPEVLLSGHHKNIDVWREQESDKITKLRRPDLVD